MAGLSGRGRAVKVAAGPWEQLDTADGSLAVHLSGDGGPSPSSVAVVAHDFPVEAAGAARTGRSLPALADMVASHSGWRVVAGCLRGVGDSSGDFSLCGWLADLGALVDRAVAAAEGGGVWVVGFGVSGSLALCQAAGDDRVRGIACLGSPATFDDWAYEPAAMLAAARQVGVVRTAGFPPALEAWAAEFTELHPLDAAGRLGGRAVLVVHGADDDEVPVTDARALAEAVGNSAELFVINGAGHRLRADPRAMALLMGWLERQRR